MAGKKTKKKTTRKKKDSGGGLGRLALVLAAAAIVFFAMVKYADTPRGQILILDLGFNRYYADVQSGLGELIVKGAAEAGMTAAAMTHSTVEDPEQPGPLARVKGTLPADRALLQLNAAIDRALGGSGGRIRSCVEKKGGTVIEMEIGTRRTVTHRCLFRIGRKPSREPGGPSGPSITVIVDDFGYFNNRLVREFLALEVPFTVSVIPGLKHTESICRQAREAGKEVICHLPMEPEENGGDQGDIPLVRTSMSGREIEKTVEKALESTPGVIGINNHMGSKATADLDVMKSVMKVCRRKKLFFVDSYTTSKSVTADAAQLMGVRTLRNDLFLDNRGDDVRENMRKIISIASRRGNVTAIMHIRKGNPDHLRWLAEEARREGVRIIRLSDMMGN